MSVRSVLRAALLVVFTGVAFQGCKQKPRIEQTIEHQQTVLSEATRTFQTDLAQLSTTPLVSPTFYAKYINVVGDLYFLALNSVFQRILFALFADLNSAEVDKLAELDAKFEDIRKYHTFEGCADVRKKQRELAQLVVSKQSLPSDFGASCIASTNACFASATKIFLKASEEIQDASREGTH
eukprot:GEMP01106296.1.p1 GENE.GEMP01106296.1~~GEMP01106296.1.p1  ORF type:complete len:213 (+),score=1.76 GEMP01106296.1:95-640(+)